MCMCIYVESVYIMCIYVLCMGMGIDIYFESSNRTSFLILLDFEWKLVFSVSLLSQPCPDSGQKSMLTGRYASLSVCFLSSLEARMLETIYVIRRTRLYI